MHDLCPVTSGAATRMTEAGFARACKGKRHSMRVGDWRLKRCDTCKGRRDAWPPELTIITMEATMTAKKQTKSANATPETEPLAELKLKLKSREETLERLAEMLGCVPGDIERAMGEMQAHVQAIRNIVEPEVAEYKPETLPDACKQLAKLYRYERTEAEGAKAQVKELKAELSDAQAQIAKLEDENREAWVALDGAGAGTLIEVAEKRWKEIETLQAQVSERDKTIKHLEGEIVELVEASALMPARGDDGQAENILRDLMRKIVDGRISLLHNA